MSNKENKISIIDGINLGIGIAIGNLIITIIIIGIILIIMNITGIKIGNTNQNKTYDYYYTK